MQPPEVPPATQQPEEENRLRWLLGVLPYGRNWYRSVMAVGAGTVLMGGAVRALMPEVRTWPIEQFHVKSREARFASSRLEVADAGSSEFAPSRRGAPAPPLLRPAGARLRFGAEDALPIRVQPTPEAEVLPDSSFLRSTILPTEEALPEPQREEARRRIRLASDGGVPPLAGARGRSVTGSSEEGAGPGSSVLRTPLIGARHEYEGQTEQEVVGNQLRTVSTPGTPGSGGVEGQSGWGGGGGMPPRERLITAIRLVPGRTDLEAGTTQAYDLQIRLDEGQWFSVSHWPEARFRLLARNGGIEQHRQADNVLVAQLDTPERLNGSEVLFEGSLQLPGRGVPLTARALVRVHIPRAERSGVPRSGQ